ncbi:MAG: type transport system ATP-binding protein [Chloroflexota bacterium]|nr:type transport system ATP-binding protein [Chloroflexota bacterium]
MIHTEGLCKFFASDGTDVKAVDGLQIEVNQGEVFGFLGPNGAGKTTTVRMLACLIAPSAGRAWVNGLEVGQANLAIQATVGILTESPGLYERLSARANLEIFAELYGVKDVKGQVEKYLRLLGLWDRRDAEAGTFSKGMKQKLAIARALLHEPPVVFMDEPTAALDPEAAKTVRDFIETLRGQGRTIFLCTHNLDEAERLCDRIGVFRQRLIAVDTPDALRRQLFGRQTVVHLASPLSGEATEVELLAAVVRNLPFVQGVTVLQSDEGKAAAGRADHKLIVSLDDPALRNPVIVQALVAQGAQIRFVNELRHSLEDVYLSLLRNNAEQGGRP